MKKILSVCLLLFILLGFTSCKENVQDNDEIEESKKVFLLDLTMDWILTRKAITL